VRPEVEAIILQAMDQNQRYTSATALQQTLEQALRPAKGQGAAPILVVPPPVGLPVAPSPRPPPPVAPALPGQPAPHLVPQSLAGLGFQGRIINGVEVILPPLCLIPAGPFMMGSDKRQDPQAEYACAVRAKAVPGPPEHGGVKWSAQLQRPNHPVVCISWQDVVAYAAWLAKVTGQLWRLPTEAEWEKAACDTDGRSYPWGNTWDPRRANTNEGGKRSTTPVGAYPDGASPYGVLDMAGNVWEWTSTICRPYPYRGDDERKDMGNTTEDRVLRGGSWINYARLARAAYRDYDHIDILADDVGARLVHATAGSP
jgi:formylglycine-generating enzyme required for sulfatase activity